MGRTVRTGHPHGARRAEGPPLCQVEERRRAGVSEVVGGRDFK